MSREREVPVRARALAGRLAALFERDVEIVERLNSAQRRLCDANERLWSGLTPDAFGLIYDGAAPAGRSQIAELLGDAGGEPAARAAALEALQQVHWQLRGAFGAYQDACEERRQLAVDVGELSERLIRELTAAGWSEQAAQEANVHELAMAGTAVDGAGIGR
jgi:hypothetical protein